MADVGGETAHTETRDGCWPLPEGWCRATLGALLPLSYGKALKKSERANDGEALVFGSSGVVGRHTEALAPAGSLIIGRKGSAGSVYLSTRPCWPIDTAYFTAPFKGMHSRYWYYQLNALHLVQHDQSTAIPSLSRDKYSPIKVALPPAAEQARIAEKIDALFSQIEAGEAALAAARRNVARYRKAVLKAAVTGALTADWRAENSDKVGDVEALRIRLLAERRAAWERDQIEKANAKGKPLKGDAWKAKYKPPVEPETESFPEPPEGWVWVSVDQLAGLITSGSRGWKKYYSDSGARFIRAQDINKGILSNDKAAFVDLPHNAEGLRTRVEQSDILVTITGANVTICARILEALPEAYVSQHVALVRPCDRSVSPFLEIWLKSRSGGLSQLEKAAYGAGKPGLSLANIQEVALALPPTAEQTEIVARVEAALEEANRLDAQLDALERASKGLRQSVLKAAFEGRLVPQDPNDEPARKLLERIKAERAKAGKTGARRRKVTS